MGKTPAQVRESPEVTSEDTAGVVFRPKNREEADDVLMSEHDGASGNTGSLSSLESTAFCMLPRPLPTFIYTVKSLTLRQSFSY